MTHRLPPLLRPLRVGIVGARRVRQGTGPYLAAFLAEEGAQVLGVVGTSRTTAAAASEELRTRGIEARPYVDARRMLAETTLDALVIASPHESHDAYLALAARAGLHVLCEKPLCWGGADAASRARRHAGAFLAQGLHLVVQAQWPCTLAAYEALFPGVLASPWRTFRMELCPGRRGPWMIPDAVPHALSLLAATLPDPAAEVGRTRIEAAGRDAPEARILFDYAAAGRTAHVEVVLRQGDSTPRPAAYGFDGHLAHRRVVPATYAMALEGDGRTVPLPDPTPMLVRSFVSRVRSGEPARVDPAAVPGVAHLVQLAAAWDEAFPCPPGTRSPA